MSNRIGRAVALPLLLAATWGCTHESTPPRALRAARAEVARAEHGPASHLQATAVDDAEAALASAEAAYTADDDDADLFALYAQRKAQLAESLAATQMARQKAHDATAQLNVLIEVRAAEARVIAERLGEVAPPTWGAAEMQNVQPPPAPPAPPSTSRAPRSTPPAGRRSGARPKAR